MFDRDKIAKFGVIIASLFIICSFVYMGINNNVKPEQVDLYMYSDLYVANNVSAGVSSKIGNYLAENQAVTQATIVENDRNMVAAAGGDLISDRKGVANISDGSLNIRKEASSDSKVVGKLAKDKKCDILSEEDGWFEIKSGSIRGYVSSDYITVLDNN